MAVRILGISAYYHDGNVPLGFRKGIGPAMDGRGPCGPQTAGVRSTLSAGARHRLRWASLSTGPPPALLIDALDEGVSRVRLDRDGARAVNLRAHAARAVAAPPEASNTTKVTLDNPVRRG